LSIFFQQKKLGNFWRNVFLAGKFEQEKETRTRDPKKRHLGFGVCVCVCLSLFPFSMQQF
jgi:hypothetical protein